MREAMSGATSAWSRSNPKCRREASRSRQSSAGEWEGVELEKLLKNKNVSRTFSEKVTFSFFPPLGPPAAWYQRPRPRREPPSRGTCLERITSCKQFPKPFFSRKVRAKKMVEDIFFNFSSNSEPRKTTSDYWLQENPVWFPNWTPSTSMEEETYVF